MLQTLYFVLTFQPPPKKTQADECYIHFLSCSMDNKVVVVMTHEETYY
jgi:hypothetical protein